MRNPVAAGANHAVERPAGGIERARGSRAAITFSTSASIDRIGDPGELWEPLIAADRDEKKVRRDSPGIAES